MQHISGQKSEERNWKIRISLLIREAATVERSDGRLKRRQIYIHIVAIARFATSNIINI